MFDTKKPLKNARRTTTGAHRGSLATRTARTARVDSAGGSNQSLASLQMSVHVVGQLTERNKNAVRMLPNRNNRPFLHAAQFRPNLP
jgi:phage-related tail fiber protein